MSGLVNFFHGIADKTVLLKREATLTKLGNGDTPINLFEEPEPSFSIHSPTFFITSKRILYQKILCGLVCSEKKIPACPQRSIGGRGVSGGEEDLLCSNSTTGNIEAYPKREERHISHGVFSSQPTDKNRYIFSINPKSLCFFTFPELRVSM
jgi:hypothetical protein